MGDRYISYFSCPKCKTRVELYDAPSCMLYVNEQQNATDRDYAEAIHDRLNVDSQ